MDGELWLGRGRFEDTSGTVRAGDANDPAWRRMRFMVFDLPGDPGTFTERVLHMRSLLDAAGVAWLRPVAQYRARDTAELDALLEAVVPAGGEGLLLQHQDARYRVGRSGDLRKYKPYDDAQARGCVPTRGRSSTHRERGRR